MQMSGTWLPARRWLRPDVHEGLVELHVVVKSLYSNAMAPTGWVGTTIHLLCYLSRRVASYGKGPSSHWIRSNGWFNCALCQMSRFWSKRANMS